MAAVLPVVPGRSKPVLGPSRAPTAQRSRSHLPLASKGAVVSAMRDIRGRVAAPVPRVLLANTRPKSDPCPAMLVRSMQGRRLRALPSQHAAATRGIQALTGALGAPARGASRVHSRRHRAMGHARPVGRAIRLHRGVRLRDRVRSSAQQGPMGRTADLVRCVLPARMEQMQVFKQVWHARGAALPTRHLPRAALRYQSAAAMRGIRGPTGVYVGRAARVDTRRQGDHLNACNVRPGSTRHPRPRKSRARV